MVLLLVLTQDAAHAWCVWGAGLVETPISMVSSPHLMILCLFCVLCLWCSVSPLGVWLAHLLCWLPLHLQQIGVINGPFRKPAPAVLVQTVLSVPRGHHIFLVAGARSFMVVDKLKLPSLSVFLGPTSSFV